MTTFSTHEVFNQSPTYDQVNLFTSDRALVSAIKAEGADWGIKQLNDFGEKFGCRVQFKRGDNANKFLPELERFDTKGNVTGIVEFHPDYHYFMTQSKEAGIHCGAFDYLANDAREKAQGIGVVRAAKHYMMSQVEAGHICPITMTHAAIPALMVQSDVAEIWLPKLLTHSHDPAFKPMTEKTGVTIGMGMTEKQGGTDVRAATTKAVPIDGAGPGKRYAITGHKWFMSAPMCDAFLVLAYAEAGLSVFLVPRFKVDGSVNHLAFQRLKNKLGNKSNASSEVEFQQAEGILLGEEGRGIANIMTMANYTRLDCALGSSGQMRQALSRAYHHVSHRQAFGKPLIEQPMMASLIADLTLESEAATTLAMRLAGAYDGALNNNAFDQAFSRVMTPVIKYWVTKRAPNFCYEAMECIGGNGYVEDELMARLYRDVPVNSIWEGAGSVMCLDFLRVLAREQDSVEQVINWLAQATACHADYDATLAQLVSVLKGNVVEAQGRWLCDTLAKLSAARLLNERAPQIIADNYFTTRLGQTASNYGAIFSAIDSQQIIEQSLLF
ncbi:acyl-CoA dehydrogenase family protein [Colwellia sp. MEBiC06753]